MHGSKPTSLKPRVEVWTRAGVSGHGGGSARVRGSRGSRGWGGVEIQGWGGVYSRAQDLTLHTYVSLRTCCRFHVTYIHSIEYPRMMLNWWEFLMGAIRSTSRLCDQWKSGNTKPYIVCEIPSSLNRYMTINMFVIRINNSDNDHRPW